VEVKVTKEILSGQTLVISCFSDPLCAPTDSHPIFPNDNRNILKTEGVI